LSGILQKINYLTFSIRGASAWRANSCSQKRQLGLYFRTQAARTSRNLLGESRDQSFPPFSWKGHAPAAQWADSWIHHHIRDLGGGAMKKLGCSIAAITSLLASGISLAQAPSPAQRAYPDGVITGRVVSSSGP